MLRFLMFLFGKKYEVCKSCEILAEQLRIERDTNKQLIGTITDLIKPVRVAQTPEQPIRVLEPLKPKSLPWHMKQKELEAQSRLQAAAILKQKEENQAIGQSNSAIEKLETELGLNDQSGSRSIIESDDNVVNE